MTLDGSSMESVISLESSKDPACRSERIGQVAQSVERQTENLRVGGSIPSLAINHFRRSAEKVVFEIAVFIIFPKLLTVRHPKISLCVTTQSFLSMPSFQI